MCLSLTNNQGGNAIKQHHIEFALWTCKRACSANLIQFDVLPPEAPDQRLRVMRVNGLTLSNCGIMIEV